MKLRSLIPRLPRPAFTALAVVMLVIVVLAAPRRRYRYDGDVQLPPDRNGVPDWESKDGFSKDVFTFVRIRYPSRWRGGAWLTDFPDSDLNFSFRLQQLTTLKVNPTPIIRDLTDPDLRNYPFIYLLEAGDMELLEEEVTALRDYLLNGGFLLVDDFWGVVEYENFHEQIKRVFPDRDPVDLDLTHPIFHCVFDLKELPQVPSIEHALRGRPYGITWEREDAKHPEYRAIYDDKGRIMVMICHNTDLGDGWEREGESEWYFHEFSEKKAYPMGVNIVFWAMTH